MPKCREVLHTTLANTALKITREQISAGHYTLGTNLDQQTPAGEFVVSVIPPIRESLRQLETEGLIRIYAYRGAESPRLMTHHPGT
jgi:DNA-binding GntR family transcriptional regulator